MDRLIQEEQRRYKRFIHVEPAGFVHHMRPGSIKTLMQHIGLENIHRARVLEVGCGQGYLVSHFLNLGAQHVIGTDLTPDIIASIPRPAFQVYRDRGQTMEFNVEDFQQTQHFENVRIITMFIGIVPLVFRLLDVFVENPHVQIIAFMKPAKQRSETDEKIDAICRQHHVSKSLFQIHLAGSGEQRQAIVMKKSAANDTPIRKYGKRQGKSKRRISISPSASPSASPSVEDDAPMQKYGRRHNHHNLTQRKARRISISPSASASVEDDAPMQKYGRRNNHHNSTQKKARRISISPSATP